MSESIGNTIINSIKGSLKLSDIYRDVKLTEIDNISKLSVYLKSKEITPLELLSSLGDGEDKLKALILEYMAEDSPRTLPHVLVFDEYSSYAGKGFSQIAAKARSSGTGIITKQNKSK